MSSHHAEEGRALDSEQAKVTLGKYLAEARVKAGMSLREVEASTGKEVSNAYLSQLEKDKIAKPSPNMLHALASVYGMPYETLMQHAGYIAPDSEVQYQTRKRPANVFTIENVTPEEQRELLKYLEFVRFSKKRT
jgi:transcriptional regulator with XRE-family HTH domain